MKTKFIILGTLLCLVPALALAQDSTIYWPFTVLSVNEAIKTLLNSSTRLVLLQMKFRSGGLGTIEVDVDDNYGYEVVVEVSGERGTLRTPSVTSPILRKGGVASRVVEADWLERFEMAYIFEAEAWVHAVLGGTTTGASVWDGYAAMRVAEAAARSLGSGKAEALPDEPRPDIYDPS